MSPEILISILLFVTMSLLTNRDIGLHMEFIIPMFIQITTF